MGVKGLWQLLESVGRPVTLESLENKVLGVDASLLLNQSVKGMRDKHGNPVPNAHLVGLFNRVCKLLYYRIKPVFVFDGGVPHLKKKTLAARKEQRFKAIHKSNRAAEKIVKNYLKAKALETVTKRKSTTTPARSKSPREPDVFELPPLLSNAATDVKSSPDDEDLDTPILEQFRSQHLEETFQDPTAIDIESEDFKALPAEIQHELIKEIQAEKKWMSKEYKPEATDFSSFQLEGVLKRGKMKQRLDELCKEMNERNSGELAGIASQDSVGENTDVKSQKILSEDTAHYILIKRNEPQQDENQDKDFSSEGGFFREEQDCEIVSWTNPRPKPSATPNVPSFDIPELCSSDSENLSPFLDVAEACLSPKPGRGPFSFSPVKAKNSLENALSKMGDNVVDKDQPRKRVSQDSQLDQLHGIRRSDPELAVIFARDSDEDGDLLSQIKDKRKELDDLIKQWKNSRDQKAVIDLTANARDEDNAMTKDKKELPTRSPEIVEVMETVEKQQEFSNIKEADSTCMQSALVIDNVKEGQEKIVAAVCISDSESETSSVEDVTALDRPDEDAVEVAFQTILYKKLTKPHSQQNQLLKLLRGKWRSTDDLQEIQTTLGVDDTTDVEENKKSSDSTVAITGADQEDFYLSRTQKDAELHVDSQHNEEMPDMEKEDSLVESKVEMDVAEPVAGPSGLPVEWQGATVEELEDIRLDLESEQKNLASEQARQNRMAATVSNEMFTECQELLQLFGVPYLVSPMEAEAQCAALDILDLTQGSITDDSDIFLFGGRRVYKNIFNQNKHAEMYGSDAVQRNLALDRSRLICIAFITGSDYTEGIQGVGTVGAMEILHEFSGEGLEGLKKFKLWHKEVQKRTKQPQETKVKRKLRSVALPKDFPSDEVYEAYLHPVVDESTELFEWGKPDLHSLRLFASEKLGWSSSRTDEILLPVLKQLNKNEVQTKINQYFQVKFQETRKVKSKRIKRVLNRTFNPSSSSSDSEDGGENNKKQNKPTDKMSGKTTKVKQLRHKKRTHSAETNMDDEDENEAGVSQAKRAKGENDKGDACSSTVNRSRGSYRGRGRGRGRWRKNNSTTPNLESSIEQTWKSFSQETSKPLPLENSKSTRRGRNLRSRPSTSADNNTETPVDSVCANNAQTRRKQRSNSASSRGKDLKSLAAEENSTSDSTDSDDNDEDFYAGPKPVSVFRRGRGRERGRGSTRGRGR
ncbi:LOW QUALITY PROTEIN: DNA excision repair protein ERCC-5-like [Oculina patagonica]